LTASGRCGIVFLGFPGTARSWRALPGTHESTMTTEK
jgi:hypothetical protein